MSKPTAVIMTGLSGSGKSTVAKELGMMRINLDDIRGMYGWTKNNWSKTQEKAAIETMLSSVDAAISNGLDIVVDNTHLTQRLPALIRTRIAGRADFTAIDLLNVPIEDCIARDKERPSPVGEDVIRRQVKTSSGARKNGWRLTREWLSNWPEIEPYKVPYQDSLLPAPEAVMIDIDGTLALHVARGPYEMEKCETDAVNIAVAEQIDAWLNEGLKIILLSGRNEDFRPQTERWLYANGVEYSHLFMRASEDSRPDYVVKYELFDKHVRHRFNVKVSLDDRNQVVAVWRQVGLPTWQVNYGNF